MHNRQQAPFFIGPTLQCQCPTVTAVAVATISALLATTVVAQATREASDTIASDRPGLGDGASVVGTDVTQLETGATMVNAGGDRSGASVALLRIGFSNHELRVALPAPVWSLDNRGTEYSDLGLGIKVPVSWTDEWRWSVIGNVTLPTGTGGVTADEYTAALTLAGEYAITDATGFALNVGANSALGGESDATVSLIPTLTFQLTDTVATYAGYGGYFRDDNNQHWLEAGATHSPAANVQWDFNSAYDVANDEWFLGVGLAYRW